MATYVITFNAVCVVYTINDSYVMTHGSESCGQEKQNERARNQKCDYREDIYT